jgi:hypothetical protein
MGTPVMVGVGAVRTTHVLELVEDAQAAAIAALLLAPSCAGYRVRLDPSGSADVQVGRAQVSNLRGEFGVKPAETQPPGKGTHHVHHPVQATARDNTASWGARRSVATVVAIGFALCWRCRLSLSSLRWLARRRLRRRRLRRRRRSS